MRERRREVTVAEVARAAGVGKATASRALGGYGAVSDASRSRVLAAAEALGYRPNHVARTMNTGRSGTIGVIVGDIENGYFALALRGISDVAQREGYDVVLLNTSEDLESEVDAVKVLLEKRVDGLIVAPASAYSVDHLQEVLDAGRPLVLLDRRADGLDAPAVCVDVSHAAEAVVDEFIAQGHRRIAFLSALTTDGDRYESSSVGISSVGSRLEGIVSSLRKHGIPIDPALIRYRATDVVASKVILDEWLALPEPPTALIASDSRIILCVLRLLRERGLTVPDDISLAVLDAVEWTEFTQPPLTGVTQPTYNIGVAAASTLLAKISGVSPPPLPPLSAHLDIRDSIAPVRRSVHA